MTHASDLLPAPPGFRPFAEDLLANRPFQAARHRACVSAADYAAFRKLRLTRSDVSDDRLGELAQPLADVLGLPVTKAAMLIERVMTHKATRSWPGCLNVHLINHLGMMSPEACRFFERMLDQHVVHWLSYHERVTAGKAAFVHTDEYHHTGFVDLHEINTAFTNSPERKTGGRVLVNTSKGLELIDYPMQAEPDRRLNGPILAINEGRHKVMEIYQLCQVFGLNFMTDPISTYPGGWLPACLPATDWTTVDRTGQATVAGSHRNALAPAVEPGAKTPAGPVRDLAVAAPKFPRRIYDTVKSIAAISLWRPV